METSYSMWALEGNLHLNRRPSYYEELAPTREQPYPDWIRIFNYPSQPFSSQSTTEISQSSSFNNPSTGLNSQVTPSPLAPSSQYTPAAFTQTCTKTVITDGTNLTFSSFSEDRSPSFFDGPELVRNIADDFSDETRSDISTQDIRRKSPTYSMRRLGLRRQEVKSPHHRKFNHRYPSRNKISPVRWWIGERAVYDDNGFLVAKDVRR